MSDDRMMLANMALTKDLECQLTLLGDDKKTVTRTLTDSNRLTLINLLLMKEFNQLHELTDGEQIAENYQLHLRKAVLSVDFDEALAALALLSSEVKE